MRRGAAVPTGAFGYIEALDVIEHVSSQATVLTEAHRVLGPGGVFWFTSPNRFYLYGPERHVMLWGVGFVPRRWQNAYVKLRKGVEYRGKRLLSRSELIRLLREAGVETYTLIEPDPIVKMEPRPRSRWGKIVRDYAPWLVSLTNRSAAHSAANSGSSSVNDRQRHSRQINIWALRTLESRLHRSKQAVSATG